MLRIGQVEATATQDGKYTDGSVAGGIAATRLRAAAFNAMQEELAHIVESAGLALDINDMTQVLKAIQKLTLSRANPFADIKSDGAAAISTALTNLGLGEAAKRDVGTGGNQIPDMGSFEFRNELNEGYVRFPQKWMLQWKKVSIPAASGTKGATVSANYLIPFTLTVIGSWANVESRTINVAASPFVSASNNNLSSFLATSTYTSSQLEVMVYSIGR